MRVFLDANVLISGIAFRGNEHALLLRALDPRHAFLVSEDVVREVRAVLGAKFPELRDEGEEFLRLLPVEVVPRAAYDEGTIGGPAARIDPGDVHVLVAAVAVRADLLATGDKGLLALGKIGRTAIVRPREALAQLGV